MQDRGNEVNQGQRFLIEECCLVLTLLISRAGGAGSASRQLFWMDEVRHLISGVRRVGTRPVERVVERRWGERTLVVVNGGRGWLGEVAFSVNLAERNFEIGSQICVLCHNPGCRRGLVLAAPPVQCHRECCSLMSWLQTRSRG